MQKQSRDGEIPLRNNTEKGNQDLFNRKWGLWGLPLCHGANGGWVLMVGEEQRAEQLLAEAGSKGLPFWPFLPSIWHRMVILGALTAWQGVEGVVRAWSCAKGNCQRFILKGKDWIPEFPSRAAPALLSQPSHSCRSQALARPFQSMH